MDKVSFDCSLSLCLVCVSFESIDFLWKSQRTRRRRKFVKTWRKECFLVLDLFRGGEIRFACMWKWEKREARVTLRIRWRRNEKYEYKAISSWWILPKKSLQWYRWLASSLTNFCHHRYRQCRGSNKHHATDPKTRRRVWGSVIIDTLCIEHHTHDSLDLCDTKSDKGDPIDSQSHSKNATISL